MSKADELREYLKNKSFWDNYFYLGGFLCDIEKHLNTTTDTEQTLLDSLDVVQQSISLTTKNRDVIDNYKLVVNDPTFPSSKEIEKSLYDLENVIVELLDEE